MIKLKWDDKDPDEYLDYGVDWSRRIGESDPITSSIFFVKPTNRGLSLQSAVHSGTLATVWIGGGTDGVEFAVTNRIGTTGGRIFEETIFLNVRTKK